MQKCPVSRGVVRNGAGGRNEALVLCRFLLALASGCVFIFLGPGASAETRAKLELESPSDLNPLDGRTITKVQAETVDPLWPERIVPRSVRAGDIPNGETARRVIAELTQTGRFAEVRAEYQVSSAAVILVVWARPRRIASAVDITGSRLDAQASLQSFGIRENEEVTSAALDAALEALTQAHQRIGYGSAKVTAVTEPTDDPMRVVLRVQVSAGDPDRVRSVEVRMDPKKHHSAIDPLVRGFGVKPGDIIDQEALVRARHELEEDLAEARFYEARVEVAARPNRVLSLTIASGPRFSIRVEGNQTFDAATLLDTVQLDEKRQASLDILETEIRDFYVKNGFLDVRTTSRRFDRADGLESTLYVRVDEGPRVRVRERQFPCLGGIKSKRRLEKEIDGVLQEQFPEQLILGPVNPMTVDQELTGRSQSEPGPLKASPYTSYSRDAYEKVADHLRSLLQSEGYLSARVGPVTLARRACERGTQPGECRVQGPRKPPSASCNSEPVAGPPELMTCTPGPRTRCESDALLSLPIVPGPRAYLYEISVTGNEHFTEQRVEEALGLEQNAPLGRSEVEAAISRLRDLYAEEGFAFADIESTIDLSRDGTRARLQVSIAERKQVHVSRIVIQGATRTRAELIRKRITLKEGDLYKRSRVRTTQDQIETLGVFTSVAVGLEDPRVPAREKVVVVTVSERMPQYLDVKGGFSTGDGFRIGFEYGHRNLGGQAIQLTLRSQLGLRPAFLIVEPDVRARYEAALSDLAKLLERRNSISLSLPETGLGPHFRFELEALDYRDNQRDYSITRDALQPRLLYRPSRRWTYALRASVERNDVSLLALTEDREDFEEIAQDNPSIRVPEGESIAFAQELSGTWDRRDRALGPSRGTIVSAVLEHVTAVPTEGTENCSSEAASPFDPTCSELLRLSGRASGYVPLSDSGLVLAVGLRAGGILPLVDTSRTYPDRLFFMGGVETIRGFYQDSMVPEDVAQVLLDPDSGVTISDVVLRGGDFFWNPRVELRIPLTRNLETAIFIDAGNLWANTRSFNLFAIRYAVGTGLRYQTPIGPLVFDYGFNVERVLDAAFPDRPNQRTWEDLGAFSFSIGYF